MTPTKEQVEKALSEFHQTMKIEYERIAKLNEEAIEFVKKHINYDFDLMELDGIEWKHEGYVQVEKSDYKSCFYPSHDFYKIKGDVSYSVLFGEDIDYMRQDDNGEFHSLVWQKTGACEDNYSGYLLFPLNNGYYWKISYWC
jgi:hypothetical protein